METKKRPSNVPLGDVAYRAILEAISSNQMKAGDRVSEYMVADWLQISRTPAREGLRRLENEGLLVSHPRRGLVVATLDDEALHELYAAREVLESAAAALAARFASDAEISALQHMVHVEAQIADKPGAMYEHNREFHQRIYGAARNRYLLKFFTSISDTLSMQRTVSTMMSPQRREEVLKEHRELVDAIARRDEEGARQVALAHIKGALRARLALQRGGVPITHGE
jgi:DNA-binding GntR family transcriptional regulator